MCVFIDNRIFLHKSIYILCPSLDPRGRQGWYIVHLSKKWVKIVDFCGAYPESHVDDQNCWLRRVWFYDFFVQNISSNVYSLCAWLNNTCPMTYLSFEISFLLNGKFEKWILGSLDSKLYLNHSFSKQAKPTSRILLCQNSSLKNEEWFVT